jgi:hypothetical protein
MSGPFERAIHADIAGPDSETMALFDVADIPLRQFALPTLVLAPAYFQASRGKTELAAYSNPTVLPVANC